MWNGTEWIVVDSGITDASGIISLSGMEFNTDYKVVNTNGFIYVSDILLSEGFEATIEARIAGVKHIDATFDRIGYEVSLYWFDGVDFIIVDTKTTNAVGFISFTNLIAGTYRFDSRFIPDEIIDLPITTDEAVVSYTIPYLNNISFRDLRSFSS